MIDVDGLPPVPLTEAHLRQLLEDDRVEGVWVPRDRPAAVYTLAGEHGGDVLEFYIETADRFVRVVYEPGETGGLRWRASPEGVPKGGDDAMPAELAETVVRNITDECDRLERAPAADRGGASA